MSFENKSDRLEIRDRFLDPRNKIGKMQTSEW